MRSTTRPLTISSPLLTLTAMLLVGLTPTPATAQSDPSHWVVTASYTPQWKIATFVQDFLSDEDETINMEGTEFRIGMGRGSTKGGDWNVAYVRKPFKDGVASTSDSSFCFSPGNNQPELCPNSHEVVTYEGVYLEGIAADWFLSFVRIKDRVQIGLNAGIGVGAFKGNVRTVRDEEQYNFVPNPGRGGGGTQVKTIEHTDETNPAKDELAPYFPFGNVGVEGAVILTPALKVKMAYGLTFPGKGFRVGVTYLIGAK